MQQPVQKSYAGLPE